MLYDIVNNKETADAESASKKGMSRITTRVIMFLILGTSLAVFAWPVFLICAIGAGIGLLIAGFQWIVNLPKKGYVPPPFGMKESLREYWDKAQAGELTEMHIGFLADNHPEFERWVPEEKRKKKPESPWVTGRTYTPPGEKAACPFNKS